MTQVSQKFSNGPSIRSVIVTLLVIAFTIALCSTALADDPTEDLDTENLLTPPDHENQAAPSDLEKRLQAQIDELRNIVETQAHKTEEKEKAQLEALFKEAPAEKDSMGSRLNIHGFFDLTFAKSWVDKDSAYNAYLPTHWSFLMSSANLYIGAQLSDSLSALMELRFSFLPSGQDRTFNLRLEDSEVLLNEYSREKARVQDPLTTEFYNANSVSIERVHLTWEPRQWFKVIAGAYLTPYGIWNVDHGSPVLIPVHPPFMMIQEAVPRNQLGLQVGGRIFTPKGIYFDYAITVSNGRDSIIPANTIDFDDSKAFGLGLSLGYDSARWRFKVGGYGYLGKSTDIEKDATANSKAPKLTIEIVDTSIVQETIISGYALFETMGLRLQSEAVWSRKDYELPAQLNPKQKVFLVDDLNTSAFTANGVGYSVYGLIAYDLPLDRWLKHTRISPFFMYEYGIAIDTMPFTQQTLLIGGLNIQPSPFVVLKAEYLHLTPKKNIYGSHPHAVFIQTAVTF